MKAHHIGLIGMLTLAPGYYATKQAIDFFYTRREAYEELARIHESEQQMHVESRENAKALLEWMQSVDVRIMAVAVDVGMIKGNISKALKDAHIINKKHMFQQGG